MRKVSGYFFTVLCVIFLQVGCNKPVPTEQAQSTLDMKEMKDMKDMKTVAKYKQQTLSSSEAKVGDNVVCPVMKTKFTVDKKSLSVTYKNKKYYVCCPDCIDELKNSPDKYLKK
jgi:YHS domain-containing protein